MLCAICQEELLNGWQLGVLLCGHPYHFECIRGYLNRYFLWRLFPIRFELVFCSFRFQGGIGACAFCRADFDSIWPLYLGADVPQEGAENHIRRHAPVAPQRVFRPRPWAPAPELIRRVNRDMRRDQSRRNILRRLFRLNYLRHFRLYRFFGWYWR